MKKLKPQYDFSEHGYFTRILKENSDLFAQFVLKRYSEVITTSTFPNILKMLILHLSIIKFQKRSTKLSPSILSNLPKVYAESLFNKIATYFDNILSKYQCGFRKEFSSEQCLIVLVEKGDKVGSFAAILTNFSKTFGCLLHYFFIAKLHAYGFDMVSLKLNYSYLCGGKQMVK